MVSPLRIAKRERAFYNFKCKAFHKRRKFTDAQDYDKELAGYKIARFKMLYDIERQCQEQQLNYGIPPGRLKIF